jgi:PhnB protein
LALEVDSAETAERYFAALAKSGNIQMVMAETFFAQRYGIVIDRFGVTWKIIVADKNVS